MRTAGLQAFGRSRSGVAAVEFAFILPVLLALYFGGFAVSQAVGIARKITITTRALADLATQYTTVKSTDLAQILAASTQIIAPYDVSPLSMRLSEITVSADAKSATVAWSTASGTTMTALVTGATVTLPSSMMKASTSYVLSETSYVYSPLTSFGIASLTFGDHIYMLPRLSASVAYSS